MPENTRHWQVVSYETPSARVPVQEFLDRLTLRQRARVLDVLDMLEEAGFRLGPPWLKKIDEDLWEVRVQVEKGQVRIIFCEEGRQIVLLHGLKKKQQKLPHRDLETARRRCKEHRLRHP